MRSYEFSNLRIRGGFKSTGSFLPTHLKGSACNEIAGHAQCRKQAAGLILGGRKGFGERS
jgi:hypothetical protein